MIPVSLVVSTHQMCVWHTNTLTDIVEGFVCRVYTFLPPLSSDHIEMMICVANDV